jgi:D-serine deaminase-like pyridoxal phosphate-dependent protein
MHTNDIDTPALLIDLDIMEKNIKAMSHFAERIGVDLRPHIKTHKIPEIAKMQIALGAVGITAQKLSEAQVMIDAGLDNVFVPYPIVGEAKLDLLVRLKKKANVMTGIDGIAVAGMLSGKMAEENLTHEVLIEVDTGLKRCGVLPGKETLDLAVAVSKLPRLKLAGIFTHEGHVYNSLDSGEAHDSATEAGHEMVSTAQMLRHEGIDIEIVSVGSTPGAAFTPRVKGVTEMRPGIYVFNDATQVRLGAATIEDCALTILTTVVSRPTANRAIVDAGSKTMSSDASKVDGTYGIARGLAGITFDRANEEHGILTLTGEAKNLRIGDRIEIIPNHVCTTVNMHDEACGVRNGTVEKIWRIEARGKVR